MADTNASFKITADVKQALAALRSLAKEGKISKDSLNKFTTAVQKAGTAVGTKRSGFANQIAGLAFIIRTTFLFSLASVGITAINRFKKSIADGIRSVIDFEQEMAEVNTLLNISRERFEELKNEVRSVFRNTPQDMDKVTRATYNLVSAGIGVNEIYSTLTQVSKAATAGVTENSVAAKAAISTMNAYRLSHENLTKVLDLEFQTVKKGILVYEDVAENIGVILPAATRLGASLEELHAAFATLTKAGLSPAMAATALSRAFDQLMERANKLKTIGIDVYDATGEFRGMAEIIGDIRYLIGNLSDEEKNRFYQITNFEIRAGRAITGLVQQYEILLETMKSMEEPTGTMEEAYNKIAETAKSKMKIAWNRLKDISREVWEGIIPGLAAVLDYISRIVAGYFVWIKLAKILVDIPQRGFWGTIKDLEELYEQIRTMVFGKTPERPIGMEGLSTAEGKEEAGISGALGPKEAMKLLDIAELQAEFDKDRIKDLKNMQIELMNHGRTAEYITSLTEDQIKIEYDLVQAEKERQKLIDEYYEVVKELQLLGIENPLPGLVGKEGQSLTTGLDFLHSKLTDAQSLVSKWQQILYKQGISIDEILKLTYEDATKLEKRLEKYKEDQKEFERNLRETTAKARYAAEYIFAYPVMDAFDALIDKTKSVSEAFKQMAIDILKSIAKVVLSSLLSRFVNFLVAGPIGSIFGIPGITAPSPVPGSTGWSGIGGARAGGGLAGYRGGYVTAPNFNIPGRINGGITIIQNINTGTFLPHTEEALRQFGEAQQTLAIKEARKIL